MANEVARSLRKRMTPQEARVWLHLRALRPQGVHFRRQVPIGRAIVDFACLRAMLVVEIDEGQHGMPGHLRLDAERDERLVHAGYRVLRFWNVEVDRSIESVIDTIFSAATDRLSGTENTSDAAPPAHAPVGAGGAGQEPQPAKQVGVASGGGTSQA